MATVDELVERIEDLESKVAAHFAANARWAATVNELNNLVAAMKGHAQLVERQPTSDKVQELVKVILTSTSRVQELIRTSIQKSEKQSEEDAADLQLIDPSTFSVLVADDEVLIRSLLYELMVKAGYNVAMAGSGADAIQECSDHIFDLILMDYQLGDTNGIQALRQIREFQTECRVIFLTGDPNFEAIRATVLKEGADGFITKPFDINEILDVVSHILQQKGAKPDVGGSSSL